MTKYITTINIEVEASCPDEAREKIYNKLCETMDYDLYEEEKK